MVSGGEERVRVHMNVVPRSTGNTNSGTENSIPWLQLDVFWRTRRASQNSQRYYTTKRLISDLLSNTPNCYVRGGELREYLFTGECVTEFAKRNEIGAGLNPAN